MTQPEINILLDVYVKNINGKWKISLNGSTKTELQVNNYYADMLNKTTEKTDIPNDTSRDIRGKNLQQRGG